MMALALFFVGPSLILGTLSKTVNVILIFFGLIFMGCSIDLVYVLVLPEIISEKGKEFRATLKREFLEQGIDEKEVDE